MAAAAEDMEAFLATCAASGEAAHGAAKAVLERLDASVTCAEAKRLLGAVRRRFAAGSPATGLKCFRTFHFRIHDVVLDLHLQGKRRELFSTDAMNNGRDLPSTALPASKQHNNQARDRLPLNARILKKRTPSIPTVNTPN